MRRTFLLLLALVQQGPAGGNVDLHGDPLPPAAVARLGTLRFRMPGSIAALVAMPDEKSLVTCGGEDRSVRLWPLGPGKGGAVVQEASDPIAAAASNKGDLLAIALQDGTLQVRSLTTLSPRFAVQSSKGPFTQVACSPDGTLLAAVDRMGPHLWKGPTGEVVDRLRGYSGEDAKATSITFTPDSKMVAVGFMDSLIRVWNLPDPATPRELKGHQSMIFDIACSPDGKHLASACEDGTVGLWDLASSRLLLTLTGHTGFVGAVAFSRDGRWLASAGRDKTIRIWSCPKGDLAHTIRYPRGPVTKIAFVQGPILAVAGEDGIVRFWDAETGRRRESAASHDGKILAAAFSPRGNVLATGGEDGSIGLWDPATGRRPGFRECGAGAVMSLCYSPDGSMLAAGTETGSIRCWGASQDSGPLIIQAHEERVTALAISPDGAVLASGGSNWEVRLWNSRTGAPMKTLKGHKGAVHSLSFARDGRRLLSIGADGTARFWDLPGGTPGSAVEGLPDRFVCAAPDASLIAAGNDGGLRFIDARSGRVLKEVLEDGGIWPVVFSADGRLLATRKMAGEIVIREVATGQPLLRFQGSCGESACVAFSPAAPTMASGYSDGSGLVWSLNPPRADPQASTTTLWSSLGSETAEKAYSAVYGLAATAAVKDAGLRTRFVEFVEKSLKEMNQAPGADQLVADLDNADPVVRENASRALEALGSIVEPHLKRVVEKSESQEAKDRAGKLLVLLDNPFVSNPDFLRRLRLVWCLEVARSEEATALLESLSKKSPSSRERAESAAALERLKRKSP